MPLIEKLELLDEGMSRGIVSYSKLNSHGDRKHLNEKYPSMKMKIRSQLTINPNSRFHRPSIMHIPRVKPLAIDRSGTRTTMMSRGVSINLEKLDQEDTDR